MFSFHPAIAIANLNRSTFLFTLDVTDSTVHVQDQLPHRLVFHS